ncbi:Putative EVE domain, PUA-like superfamily, AT hook, DNA-binding protein [Septoria linicola]|uniref:EVE domain, PUA-like superfamily, AT hook, DNA-binding protein n=1 Tax=Septoria linicola TaxID=215465 RepID=A0A9Q9EG14_9PEZI|nr:Putative EVE domain, PUA-like superfamily, AT hook, DNA-binding protein [Septoria linicola]
MAPKKKAVNKTTRPKTPATVTSKRGKEYETTAAASRPSRTAAQTDLSFPDTAPERAANKPIVPSTMNPSGTRSRPPRPAAESAPKRGRPAKTATAPAKRARGRPPKSANTTVTARPAAHAGKRGPGRPPKSTAATSSPVEPAKRGPGRPPKSASTPSTAKAAPAAKSSATSKKRGRPAKEAVSNEPPKKRVRPSRASALADAVPPEDQQPTPKKRGAPPYGGETTKVDSDDDAAAEQLEEELQDEVDEPISAPKKRGRPAKGKGKAMQAATNDVALQSSGPTSAQGRQYWLMKAEQDGHDVQLKDGSTFNTRFTIDDLQAKTVPEPWDGVRNPSAAKNMRTMKQGDLAFFYASGGKMPGIVGIMEIVQEASPDVTAHDETSAGYVENAKQRDRWCVVHVEFRKKFSRPITRTELLAAKDAGPLAKMQEFTAARLSVSKVSEDEWHHIHSLIENLDERDSDQEEDGTPVLNGSNKTEEDALSSVLNGAGEDILESTAVVEQEIEVVDLPSAQSGAPSAVMASTEDLLMPTTDSLFPPTDIVETSAPLAAASSRPTSRGSRAGSAQRTLAPRAGSRTGSRAGSRAGSAPRSLAPPKGRARSTTPQQRAGSAQPSSGGLMEAIGEE